MFTEDKGFNVFITAVVIIVIAVVVSVIYDLGYTSGVISTTSKSTTIVCNREANAAPRDWCEKTILLEVLKNK